MYHVLSVTVSFLLSFSLSFVLSFLLSKVHYSQQCRLTCQEQPKNQIVGALLAVLAAIMGNTGLSLQKTSHNRNAKQHPDKRKVKSGGGALNNQLTTY